MHPLLLGVVQVEAAGVIIPSTDDGTTVILRGLPKAWGVARVRAYTERYSQRPLQVAKPDDSDWAVVVFASADSRAAFVEKREEHLAASQSADNFRLEFPGEYLCSAPQPVTQPYGSDQSLPLASGGSKPPQHQQQQHLRAANAGGPSGTKRSAGEAGAGPSGAGAEAGRARKQRRTDVREAVCPLWDVPYKDQLARKLVAIQDALKDTAKQVRGVSVRPGVWLVCVWLVCVWGGGHGKGLLEQQLLGDEPYKVLSPDNIRIYIDDRAS
jgi:hypothetical protein